MRRLTADVLKALRHVRLSEEAAKAKTKAQLKRLVEASY
ncbi:hypothetical protein BH11ARM2_BH11ARM2_00720 [soil metagenome]